MWRYQMKQSAVHSAGSVLEYTGEVENMYPDVRVHTRKMTMISKIYLFCATFG